MLPILVQHLPRDRERMGLRPVQMAGRLGLNLTEYRALEAGGLSMDGTRVDLTAVKAYHSAT